MIARRQVLALTIISLAAGIGMAAEPSASSRTPLDDYVAKPDPTYAWTVIKTVPGDGVTTFIVDMKSQTWRSSPEVNRPVWQHWLVIVKPDVVKYDTGFLTIGGGSNGRAAPNGPSSQSLQIAKATNTVVAELGMVPNQPLIFNDDGKGRYEDDLIAYCWIKFMDTKDPTWLPRLAMVKSAVRAMDTVQALLGSEQGGKTAVNKFVVAGGSKRGWTTWLTGVVDKRVTAIVPVVIDVVNVKACSLNHFCAYGFFAPAIGDYTRHKIYERRDTPEYAELLKIEDPYSYIDRLTLPKFVINASGDQFFPPDSSKFYYHDLKGPKYLRYVPNANHSLQNSDGRDSILAFYLAILKGERLPRYSWKVQPDGSIRVESATKPLEVNLWQATNPEARDFRLEKKIAYKKSPLASEADGLYIAKVEKPPKGWTAFFAELVYDSGEKIPYKFTTEVHVVPDVLPHTLEDLKKFLK